MTTAVGLLELYSVARGLDAADAGCKAAAAELVLARPFCAGKFAALWSGEVAAVRAALTAGTSVGAHLVVGECLLPAVHPDLLPALGDFNPLPPGAALGVVEAFNIAGTLRAADAAAKAAPVTLVEVRVAVGLGGRGYFLVAGETAAARQALETAAAYLKSDGLLVDARLIPAPHPDLVRRLELRPGNDVS
jgi:microcompartment protein CcmL/EutN